MSTCTRTPPMPRQPYKVTGTHPSDEVLPLIGSHTTFKTGAGLTSDRLRCFARSHVCASCGAVGEVFLSEQPPHASRPHLNLYAWTEDGWVQMTKDHIVPKAKGGADKLHNLQTLCYTCNQLKGDS